MLLVHMVPTMSWFILLRLSYATTFKDSLLTVHLGVLALTTTQSKFSPSMLMPWATALLPLPASSD